MERQSGFSGPSSRRHSRNPSQGGWGCDTIDENKSHAICPDQLDVRLSQLSPHLNPDYVPHNHIHSNPRLSWDGRLADPRPGSRSPSPGPSPPQSPIRRSYRERPCSVMSLPEQHGAARPTLLRDRWSYDRERMPSPPGSRHSSRPGTPLSDASMFASSRPASTFIGSRPPSRPQSIIFNNSSTDPHTPSTPTLRLYPPPLNGPAEPIPFSDRCDSPSRPESRQSLSEPRRQSRDRHPYHILTPTEMEMLSHPPPSPTPRMSPLPPPATRHSSDGTPTANDENTVTAERKSHQAQGRGHTTTSSSDDDGKETRTPGCCLGLCEIATARRIGGTFGAWLMGTMIPVTFGLVTGCIAASTSCR